MNQYKGTNCNECSNFQNFFTGKCDQSPIPLKPKLVRGSSSRRKVPPISDISGESYDGQDSARDSVLSGMLDDDNRDEVTFYADCTWSHTCIYYYYCIVFSEGFHPSSNEMGGLSHALSDLC